jgi:hypothetical protein
VNNGDISEENFVCFSFEVTTGVTMKSYFLECNALKSDEGQPIFRRNISPPCSWLKKSQAMYPSEVLFDFHRSTQFYIPEDGTVQN